LDEGSSDGAWSLMEPSEKGKKGKSMRDRAVKRERKAAGNR
jgi:hypothetical protein